VEGASGLQGATGAQGITGAQAPPALPGYRNTGPRGRCNGSTGSHRPTGATGSGGGYWKHRPNGATGLPERKVISPSRSIGATVRQGLAGNTGATGPQAVREFRV